MATNYQQQQHPLVLIAGGGPAGLLSSILLDKIGVQSIVIEKAVEPDEWSSKSYTLVLGKNGKASLAEAGCLEAAADAGIERRFIYFYDASSGDVKAMPKEVPGIGFTRPLLVQVLEQVAVKCPGVTLKRGAGVSHVTKKNKTCLEVTLEDGSVLSASHVIGADGKWSNVRESFQELSSQFTMETCPSFGVQMNLSTVPASFKSDGTYVIKPSSADSKFYVIVAPRPETDQGLSIAMVLYDQTLEKYPWLAPPADMKIGDYGKGGWKDEYSALPGTLKAEENLSDNLRKLFQEELPAFYNAIKDDEIFQTARINRRITWLKMNAEGGSYSTQDGMVALIGDAAHAMTPSMGEGCNTAMESAVKLIDSIKAVMEQKGEEECSLDAISDAFVQYGCSRPAEMKQVQEASAARSMGPK